MQKKPIQKRRAENINVTKTFHCFSIFCFTDSDSNCSRWFNVKFIFELLLHNFLFFIEHQTMRDGDLRAGELQQFEAIKLKLFDFQQPSRASFTHFDITTSDETWSQAPFSWGQRSWLYWFEEGLTVRKIRRQPVQSKTSQSLMFELESFQFITQALPTNQLGCHRMLRNSQWSKLKFKSQFSTFWPTFHRAVAFIAHSPMSFLFSSVLTGCPIAISVSW